MSAPRPLEQLTQSYREGLSACFEQMVHPHLHQVAGERQTMHHGAYTSVPGFSKLALEGLERIKAMQLEIDNEELAKVIAMDFAQLPALDGLVKSAILQERCGISHTQMLLIFERACACFEQEDPDMALGIFLALLFLNPFIAALWYCVARAFESKGQFERSFYCYAMCELLTKGSVHSALDAAECLLAKGSRELAFHLLLEVETDLRERTFPLQTQERARQLRQALA